MTSGKHYNKRTLLIKKQKDNILIDMKPLLSPSKDNLPEKFKTKKLNICMFFVVYDFQIQVPNMFKYS